MADDLDKENQETAFGFEEESEFDDFDSHSKLGSKQNSTIFKVGVIAAAFVLIIASFFLFGGSSSDKVDNSDVGTGGSGLKQAPTTAEVSASYEDSVQQYNEENAEEAELSGESFIPIPVGQAQDTGIIVPEEDTIQEDPLERWRLLQEQREQQQRNQIEDVQNSRAASGEPNPEEKRRQEAVEILSQAMLGVMDPLSQKTTVRDMNIENIMDDKQYYKNLEQKEHDDEIERLNRRQELAEKKKELAESDPTYTAFASTEEAETLGEVIISEGTIEYAQTLIQANSDIPGPVLAQIVTGPLAGARIIGSFEVENKYLVINFSTVIIDGRSVSISAIAVDPDTNLTGVVTEVDNRYFKRLVLPVAAEFISGLAGAIAETQTTTNITGDVVVQNQSDLDTDEEIAQAIEDAGDKISEFVEEEADRTEVLVKVAAGTPIGVLFISPLVNDSATTTARYDSE